MVAVPSQFDAVEAGILLHDSQTGEILYVNSFAEEVYGYSKGELQNMGVADFSADSFSEAEALQRIQAAADGNPQQFEWRNKRPSGELYWVEVRLSEVTIDEKSYVIAWVQDITGHKMSLRYLRVLTRITRHNLRNKLNIIEGALEFVDKQTTDSEMLDRIRRSVSELLTLTGWVDTIKSINRRETTAHSLDISEVVTELGSKYESKYPEITWQFDCAEAIVSADSTLRRAIDELITNAVQHNPHDGLEISLTVTEYPTDNQVCIRITDTGIQIPEVEIEPFESGYDPNPLEHSERIGLWEVQTIINTHRGRLSIEENTSEQKTIAIWLPRA